MPTFIYSPQIRVRIACDGSKKADQKDVEVIDISEDLVQGTLSLRTSAVHTFNFQLQNAMRKYDGYIQPMDRITIEMKRVTWVRVFSGYLNNGPVFSAFPRVIQLSASCTMKRLQFWFWDPTTTTAFNLLTQMTGQQEGQGQRTQADNVNTPDIDESQTNNPATPTNPAAGGPVGAPPAGAGAAAGASGGNTAIKPYTDQKFDDGIKGVVIKLLSEVVGWPSEKVHIGEVPKKWIEFAESIGNKILKDADQTKQIGSLAMASVGGGGAGGPGGMANGVLQAGNYGGTNYDAEQAANASTIFNVAIGTGLDREAAIIGIMTAWQESSMRNINHGDRDSLGLFQQRAAWGPAADRTNPAKSAGMFYNGGQGGQRGLKAFNWRGMSKGQAAQKVQVSAFPAEYAKWEGTARAAVDVISRSPGAGQVTGGGVAPGPAVAPAAGGGVAPAPGRPAGAPAANSGRKMAQAAHGIIASKPPGHIRYQLGNDDPYNSPDPRVLDCSSFVDCAHFRACGRPPRSGRSNTGFLRGWAQPSIPYDLALKVKGALLHGPGHVEVSLGNGTSAAARTDSNPIEKQVYIGPASRGDGGGLIPGFNYADAATDQASADQLSRIVGYPVTPSDPNEFGPGAAADSSGTASGSGIDPFNALINIYTWGFNVNVSGDNYAGPRAMMNDTPILPYIKNLLEASMRSFCSAPNGDFIAWFPDYFGIFGTAGKMNVKTIELQDFTVEWNDQKIVTHQYVVGAPNGFVNQATGSISGTSTDASGNSLGGAGASSLAWELMTGGIATMEYPELFRLIFGRDASPEFLKNYLSRFGGRPDMINMPALRQGLPEFFMAMYLFMQRWAAQFKATVPMTFMPELWPGMILALPEYNFQAYITEVQHTFRFGPGGGFQTQAQICAPAKTDVKDSIFELLPLGGKSYMEETGKTDRELQGVQDRNQNVRPG